MVTDDDTEALPPRDKHVNVCFNPRDCCGVACTRQLLGGTRCQDAGAIGASYPSIAAQQELANIEALRLRDKEES